MFRYLLVPLGLAFVAGAAFVHLQPPGPPRGRGKPTLVMPPFVRDRVELTAEEEKKLQALEEETRAKLKKILGDKKFEQFERAFRRGPGGRGPSGPGGPPGREGPPPPPPDEKEKAKGGAAAGIQWFATWESALAEAKRTDRPIFLVSAAPHCAGVSGIW